MIKSLSFQFFLGLGLSTVMCQTIFADQELTAEETNTIVKEDIAATQVMGEICPTLIGKNAQFDKNIKDLIQSYLKGYTDKSMTYNKIQSDNEYQDILKEARDTVKDSPIDEQKTVCNEVLNYQG